MFENWRIVQKNPGQPTPDGSGPFTSPPWQPCVPQVEPFRSFYLKLSEADQRRYDAMSFRQRQWVVGFSV